MLVATLKDYVVRLGLKEAPHNVKARDPLGAAILVLMDFKHLELPKLLRQFGTVMIVTNGNPDADPLYFDVEELFNEVRHSSLKVRIDDES